MAPLRLIEPVPIEDDYVSALALIEDLGPLARFVWYVRATCYESGEPLHVVKRKLLVPRAAIAANHAVVARFLAGHPMPGGTRLHVVR